jgi:hypothetical protein
MKTPNPGEEAFSGSAQDLEDQLAAERAVKATRNRDELERLTGQAGHERDLADLAESVRTAERDRARREKIAARDHAQAEEAAAADADLARLYRETNAKGRRTWLAATMARSAEARELGLSALDKSNALVLGSAFVGCAALSTVGVQEGLARLTQAPHGGLQWWIWWVVEPVLIGVVGWLIIGGAKLRRLGGKLNSRLRLIQAACLSASVAFNLTAATGTGRALIGSGISHAVWPLGAALMAHALDLFSRSISATDPYTEADGKTPSPRMERLLADLDNTLRTPSPIPGSTPPGAFESAPESTFESTSAGAVESTATAPESTPESTPAAPESTPESTPAASESTLESIAESTPAVSESAVENIPAPAESASETVQTDSDLAEEVSLFLASRTASELAEKRVSEAPSGEGHTRPNKGVPVPEAARLDSTEPSPRALSDDQLRERLIALVLSGQVERDASIRQVQGALGVGFERAKRIHDSLNSTDDN